MIKLEVKKFFGTAICKERRIGVLYSECSPMSCSLFSGINALKGSIDDGGWALAYSIIRKRALTTPTKELSFSLNSNQVSLNTLNKVSFNLGVAFPRRRVYDYQSIKTLLKIALRISKLSFSIRQICDMFQLDDNTLLKRSGMVSVYHFRCQAAIGFAANKDIFCFPWLSYRDTRFYAQEVMWLGNLLKKYDKIVIVPTEKPSLLKGNQINIINFTKGSDIYL